VNGLAILIYFAFGLICTSLDSFSYGKK